MSARTDMLKRFGVWISTLLYPLAKTAPELYRYIAPLILTIAALIGPFAVLGLLLVAGMLVIRVLRQSKVRQDYLVRQAGRVVQRISAKELSQTSMAEAKLRAKVEDSFGRKGDGV